VPARRALGDGGESETVNLLVALLYASAVTLVFTRGSIFIRLRGGEQRAREAEAPITRLLRDWASCPLCCGVWFGAGYFAALRWGSAQLQLGLELLGAGCSVGVIAAAGYALIDFLSGDSYPPPPPPPALQPPNSATSFEGTGQSPSS
jgi:hypothetical protein